MKFEIPREIERELQKKGGWENFKKNFETDKVKKIEKTVKAISDEKRLKILYALLKQRMCVCMIVDVLKCSYSKCSYHISKLKEANLIKATKRGSFVIYSLTPLGKSILKHLEKYVLK
ncbi:MAG: winged helix-turn-helix transcriptional regulator [Thermoplasmata archaeon]|nr:MAG: winged helix-turn-helix transcriptional regulator [Thermoplasmata archaeon]